MPDRQAFAAIVYVLRTGIQWNAFPRELGASFTTFLGGGASRHHFFVADQNYPHGGQDHGRIGLLSMTYAEMDPIEVQHTPMFEASDAPATTALLLGTA